MVAPAPSKVVVFRSVDRPELVLDETEDVWPCDTCQGLDSDGCPDCRGHRLIHGYAAGRGLPVVLEDTQGGAASAATGSDAHLTFANNRRSPRPAA